MQRFLLVKLGALGDIVHAIPVAAALRRAFPTARIEWLVSAKHREILDLVPVIDERIALDDRGEGRVAPLLTTVRRLRQRRYDAAIDLQGLLKSAVLARLSGARRVIGFSARYARESLARFLYTDVHDPGGPGMYHPGETRHIVDINLGLLTPLGVPPRPSEFPIECPDSPAAQMALAQTGGCYALLNPGAAWPNKRWPADRFGELAGTLHARSGVKSVVLWGPGERALAEQVVAKGFGAAVIAAETSIADVVALARAARVMVSGDTGPTHIAAAMGTPVVGIYGPTRPERNGPWRSGDEWVSRAAICHCHHLRRCQAERMCLLDISVGEVLSAVERRLAAVQGSHA